MAKFGVLTRDFCSPRFILVQQPLLEFAHTSSRPGHVASVCGYPPERAAYQHQMDIPTGQWPAFWRDCIRGMTIRGPAAKWGTSQSSVQRAMKRVRRSSPALAALRAENTKL